MTEVLTPDGWGQVLRSQSTFGRTSHFVKGAGFEGWYDGLQVTSDFAEVHDYDYINDDNETTLPYPSMPQGPGKDLSTSSIPPDVDPDIDYGQASDSLTGELTDEDPVEADIEGLFEPLSRLASAPRHRLHFANGTDPILDVSDLPEDSPTGLENSPINPDGVDTDDLFNGQSFESRTSSYDRLVIEDDLSFLKFASEDDCEDDNKREKSRDFSDSDDDDSDDDSDDSSSDSGSDSGDSGSSGGDGGDGGGSGHTAAFALTTTSDLHFLANVCHCVETLPLHSKVEHQELVAEGGIKNKKKRGKPLGSKPLTGHHGDHNPKTPSEAGYSDDKHGVAKTVKKNPKPRQEKGQWGVKHRKVDRPIQYAAYNGVEPQERDLDDLLERYQQDQFTFQESNLPNLVDHSLDDEDNADLWNHYSSIKTAAPAADPDAQPTQIESQIEQLMQFWAVDNNSWWHWTGSQADLAMLNQMQQQMMAVGMPGGPPGQMQAQSAVELPEGFQVEASAPAEWRQYLQVLASDRLVALAAWKDVVAKSVRLRSEGAVAVEAFRPDVITAYVQGDNGRYYTTVQRLGSVQGVGRQGLTASQVSGWSCECDWGHWAWLRKRSFVGRMCSHAYALFSEMRSLDARQRRSKGKPGRFASVANKTAWTRTQQGGFAWVSDEPTAPTGAIIRIAADKWSAQVWSDGTSEDALGLGVFKHSEQARRAISRTISDHFKVAGEGDVDVVGGEDTGEFPPYGAPDSVAGSGGTNSPYSEDGDPEAMLPADDQQGSPGIEESRTRVGFSLFGAADDGQDDEGPESEDDGIEEADPDDEESLDEEIAEDTDDSEDGAEDEDESVSTEDDDGGHDEPHQRDDDDESSTDNPGDESDGDGIEKESSVSVAELQTKFGLSHLAGANYSLSDQDKLVREAEGKTARNRGNLNLNGTHYEAAQTGGSEAEDVLAFLF